MSQLFSQTIRENPSETDLTSHQLLLRAGFIRQLDTGIFSFLPLAKRSLTKIENIIRQAMNAINGQEISMPFIQPADLWKESGRWFRIGNELGRFIDKNNHEMILSMTHGEVIADLVRKEVRSYRQLPQLLYHVQTQWHDIPHLHAGLLKSREFTIIEGYSLDVDWEGLDIQYEAHQRAFQNIFQRCNLPVIISKSDTGIMGGMLAHEYVYPSPVGENAIIICENCGYSANIKIANAKKVPIIDESQLIIEKVSTPNCKTIEDLAKYLSIPANKTAKALLVIATIVEGNKKHEQFVIAIVRGDMELNEAKLANALNAIEIRPAIESEIRMVGAVPGYASPVGLNDVFIIVDELIPMSSNLVSGANIEGYHLLNVNYSRDYKADIIADITSAHDDDLCAECNHPLHIVHAVEVGKIFKLGTHYSESMDCNYLDRQGKSHPIIMGSYGVDVGRLMACIAEEHHDEKGLIWPITVSPFTIHLVSLSWSTNTPSGSGPKMAEELYKRLKEEQIECLFDDREQSPGVKFNDADLIGNPIRLTISERSIKNGGIEFKRRDLPEKNIIPYENIIPRIHAELDRLD
jgi:prolyl-tRNA synthetase